MPRDFLDGGNSVRRKSSGGGNTNAFELEAELSTLNAKIEAARKDMAKQIASYCLNSSTRDPQNLIKTIDKTLSSLNITEIDRCDVLIQALALVAVNR